MNKRILKMWNVKTEYKTEDMLIAFVFIYPTGRESSLEFEYC